MISGNMYHNSGEARTRVQSLRSWLPDWNQCGPTLLQRVSEARGFPAARDPIFQHNDVTGLFLKVQIVGTLDALKENTNIANIVIHLSNSRSRASRELPQVYSDKRVYVFPKRPRNSVLLETQLPVKTWGDICLPKSNLRSVQ